MALVNEIAISISHANFIYRMDSRAGILLHASFGVGDLQRSSVLCDGAPNPVYPPGDGYSEGRRVLTQR